MSTSESTHYNRIFLGFLWLGVLLGTSSLAFSATENQKGVKWGALPVFNFTSDQGLNLGAIGQRFDYGNGKKPFENLLTVQASMASQGNSGVLGIYETPSLFNSSLRSETTFYLTRNKFQRYYGTGDNTILDKEKEKNGFYYFTLDTIFFDQSLRKNIFEEWDGQVGFGYRHYSLKPNKSHSQLAKEFGDKIRNQDIGSIYMGVILDKRNSEFIPDKGSLYTTTLTLSPSFISSEPAWGRLSNSYRFYLPLIENRWLWLASQIRYSASSAKTPLLEKVGLGSASSLRGLRSNRYLSNHSTTLRSELRTLLIRTTLFKQPLKAGLGIFGEVGKVGNQLDRLISNSPVFSGGLSFFGSFFTDDFLGRTDIGFTSEGFGLYVGLGHVI